jgi:hypothetical protein
MVATPLEISDLSMATVVAQEFGHYKSNPCLSKILQFLLCFITLKVFRMLLDPTVWKYST